MTYTKATIADLDHAGATATATGRAASDAGESAVGIATQVEHGVGQVTDTLVTHVRTLASAMRDEAAAASARLGAADWEGRARAAADDAERLLRIDIDRVLSAAEVAADGLREAAIADAAGLLAEIRGRSQVLLTAIDAAYRDLAGAESAFATELLAADGVFGA